MIECLNCKRSTINKKFCSRHCSNNYNIDNRKKANQNGPAKRRRKCKGCSNLLSYSSFSYIDKFNIKGGKRKICKRCSKNKVERERRERTWKHDVKRIMLNNARQRAKNANIDFKITTDDFEIPYECPVLGIKLYRCSRDNWKNSPSIDRIDNSKGYIPNNIMVISRRANILKKDATLEELVLIGKFYADFCS